MRRFYRPSVRLPTLTAPGKGATRAAEHVAARQADPAVKLKFADHWNEPDVRGALLAMQGWVCAYCQRRPSDARGEVDHFRPKGADKGAEHLGYWWLAYSFENFLIACHDCNHHRKGSKFPLEEGTVCADYWTRAPLSEEARLLVDPCEDPVDEWMRVDWMSLQEEGFLRVRLALLEGSREERRVSKSICVFRLNSDLEIRRPRVLKLRAATHALRDGDHETVRRLACRYLPHGSAVHNLVEDVNPAWLPTRKEELLVFLHELKETMRDLLERPKRIQDPESERTIDEILWAFAVLWKAAPPGTMTPDEVAQWLDAQGQELRRVVEMRYIKL